jgi:hypothetical protein
MAVYRGVVKGSTVVLSGPVDLPDGAEVEVRPVAADRSTEDAQTREDAFERRLLEIGVIKRIPMSQPDPPGAERALVAIDGPPLSEMLIQDRR